MKCADANKVKWKTVNDTHTHAHNERIANDKKKKK